MFFIIQCFFYFRKDFVAYAEFLYFIMLRINLTFIRVNFTLTTQLHCAALIVYCKSADKAVLEPLLILQLQVTQPMSNMFYSMF